MGTLMQAFAQIGIGPEPRIGDRIRYKRPRSNVWREGTVKRYSYDVRSGRPLLQVSVDTVGGGSLYIPSTARIDAGKVEIIRR